VQFSGASFQLGGMEQVENQSADILLASSGKCNEAEGN
jgi:hypothetical protein